MKIESLRQAEEVVAEANRLRRSQEQEVARLRLAGISAARAETLLAAYRKGARLAIARWQFLQTDSSG